jgi:hypothetical protein
MGSHQEIMVARTTRPGKPLDNTVVRIPTEHIQRCIRSAWPGRVMLNKCFFEIDTRSFVVVLLCTPSLQLLLHDIATRASTVSQDY